LIRLITTDLDGTLLEEGGILPDGTFEVVRQLGELGIRFAACSGRQPGNLARLFGPVADQMAYVCENGAVTVLDGKVAGTIPIQPEDAKEIIADLQSAGMNLLISGQHCCYMVDENRTYTDFIIYHLRNTITILNSFDQITEPMLKISGQIDEGLMDIAPAFLAKWGNRLTATVSGRDWFDFTAANKGMGMRMLMDHMKVKKEEVVAFGDNFNDETMLDCVGHPFIMAHANPALHKPGYRKCQKVLPVLRAIVAAKGDEKKAFAMLSE